LFTASYKKTDVWIHDVVVNQVETLSLQVHLLAGLVSHCGKNAWNVTILHNHSTPHCVHKSPWKHIHGHSVCPYSNIVKLADTLQPEDGSKSSSTETTTVK